MSLIFRILLNPNLNSSARDEEPLVNAAVNRSGRKVLALGDAGKLGLLNTVRGGFDGRVGTVSVSWHSNTQAAKGQKDKNLQVDVTLEGLSSNEVFPRLSALMDNVKSVPKEYSG